MLGAPANTGQYWSGEKLPMHSQERTSGHGTKGKKKPQKMNINNVTMSNGDLIMQDCWTSSQT